MTTAVFSQPPIGTVGLTEDEARRKYAEIDVYSAPSRLMKNTLSRRDERTLMKIVVDVRNDRVVGCRMLGVDAPEMAQGLAIAIKCGATKQQFQQTVGTHRVPRNSPRCVKNRPPGEIGGGIAAIMTAGEMWRAGCGAEWKMLNSYEKSVT